jgi:hypothetical protein
MSQDKSHPATQGVHPDEKQRDDAEAKMKSAPLATVSDLPEDHPIRRRQEMMEHIGGHSDAEGSVTLIPATTEDDDGSDAAAEAERARLASESAKAEQAERKETEQPAPKPAEKSEVAAEIASQAADDASVLDLSALEGKNIRIKVDGVETLVPAAKVLGQFQKGAAADVRLANATKAERDARTAATKILDDARAEAVRATASPVAQTKANAEQAVAKFKEANEAIFVGEAEKAAQLFSEGVALIQTPAATGQPFDQATMVQEVARGVKAQLSQERALDALFTDYPEFKTKRAFQIVVDEAIAAKVTNGTDMATAIREAGDEVAEEYKLGKFGAATEQPRGRQIKVPGSPTTVDAKRAAKDGIDNVAAGNARVASPDDVVETPQSVIEQMQNARAGARVI